MKLSELMRIPPVVVDCRAPLWRVAELMNRTGYGFLPVTDGNKVVGVVTGRDLAVRASAQGLSLETIPVSEIMTAPAIVVRPETEIEDALVLMRQRDLRRLPVVDSEGRPQGVLGLSDLVGAAPDSSITKNLQRHAENVPKASTEYASAIPGLYMGC